jgi:hypothetical protein
MKEWSTKSVRDAFFASPKFPRLLNVEAVRQAIQNGVANGFFAYVGKSAKGDYTPFLFGQPLMTGDIELTEEMFLIKKDAAEEYQKTKAQPTEPKPEVKPEPGKEPEQKHPEGEKPKKPEQLNLAGLAWTGEIPPQKWMNFYTKVLSKFASGQGLRLKLNVEVKPDGGITKQRMEETKAALRELGMSDDVDSLQ